MHGSNFTKQHSETVLWLEIAKMLIAVREKKYCVIYYSFRHNFVLGALPSCVDVTSATG